MNRNLLLGFILEKFEKNDKHYLMLFENVLKNEFNLLKQLDNKTQLQEIEYKKLQNLFSEEKQENNKNKENNLREDFIIKDIFKKRNIKNQNKQSCQSCEFFIICKSLGLLKKEEICNDKEGEINLIYDIFFNNV